MTYSGTNPTAKQSKELLANALAQLLSTKKFTQPGLFIEFQKSSAIP
jgi:hypothetical protein